MFKTAPQKPVLDDSVSFREADNEEFLNSAEGRQVIGNLLQVINQQKNLMQGLYHTLQEKRIDVLFYKDLMTKENGSSDI